ncbi:MAG: hypothetical protein XD84_1462 [Desulfotomaculum sp. 46_80]|nr:MAG: hypothetical protein XD84_1462 [Desulfotomaculum sp. 46_80]
MIGLQRIPKYTLLFTLLLLFIPGISLADDSSAADNCFVMISAALVMLMYYTPPYLYGLSAYVCHNYSCPYSGSSRRADELFGVSDLHLPLVYFSIRSPGSLGLGSGRMASRKRLPGFCRRCCGTHQRRIFRVDCGSGSG